MELFFAEAKTWFLLLCMWGFYYFACKSGKHLPTLTIQKGVLTLKTYEVTKLGNFNEIVERLGTDDKVLSRPQESKFLTVALEKWEKLTVKH